MKKETLTQWQQRQWNQAQEVGAEECWVVGDKVFTIFSTYGPEGLTVHCLEREKPQVHLTSPESQYETLGGCYRAILLNLQRESCASSLQ